MSTNDAAQRIAGFINAYHEIGTTDAIVRGIRTGEDAHVLLLEDLQALLTAYSESDAWSDAGLTALRAWERFSEANTPSQFADSVTDLSDAMSDLASWLPGYDYETGTVPEDDD